MDELRRRARALRNHPTLAEHALWEALRRRELVGYRFRRQVPAAGYIVDFVCPQRRLVVQIDGSQHLEAAEYDATRTRSLERLGVRWCATGTTTYCATSRACLRLS